MSAVGDLGLSNNGSRKPRILVAGNHAQRDSREHDSREAMSRRRTRSRLRVAFSRLIEPRVLVVLGIIAFAAFSGLAYYYTKLSAEIDARLSGNFFDNSAGIFTSPFKVSVGDRLSVAELTGYLQAAGYREQSDLNADSNNAASGGAFTIQGGGVKIAPGRVAMSQLDLQPISIEIDERNRVSEIADLKSGRALKSSFIEGELLASIRGADRSKKTAVTFSEIPEHLRNAVIAVEDRRFFAHSGIDWRGIARAFWADLNEGEIVQGGSTITQQLVKNAFLTSERAFTRKVKEAMMAVILESRLSKEEIFTLYCNDVYLGHSGSYAIHGFAEAAQVFFGKHLDELTLAESAFLAGLIHAPNRYATERDRAKAIERRNLVLSAMAETGAVAAEQADRAKQEPLQIKKHEAQNDYGARYFIDYAQRFLENRYRDSAMAAQQRIHTTMDPRLQRAAYEAVKKNTERLDKIFSRAKNKAGERARVQAALIALDANTGEVLAMIGGRDYDDSQLNRATDARRQPGSVFKPFIYASALGMRSYTAASLISDRPQEFSFDGGREKYTPSNYHGSFTNRDVTLREALARSLNVPAVELASRVGFGSVAALAEACGLSRPHTYPSMALGTSEVTPLELAGAYTAFANEGTALRPIPVKSISSRGALRSTSRVNAIAARAFSPQVSYLMTNLMQSVVDAGTASQLRALGVKGAVAGKTGTSNDGWFAGYTPNMVCVVWVGFDDNTDLQMKASETALPIWADFVKEATDVRPELGGDSFARPAGIVTAVIDPTTGFLAGPQCTEQRQELFIAGTEPYSTCMHNQITEEDLLAGAEEFADASLDAGGSSGYGRITLEVCKETGLLAAYDCDRVQKTFDIGKDPLEICKAELHRRRKDAFAADEGRALVTVGKGLTRERAPVAEDAAPPPDLPKKPEKQQ